jgi:glycosyltransferase involved in cell wall biosynthesis
LKAMAAGLPVLATKVSGAEDIIIDGENGRLLPPRRPDALARAVLELHSRPELMPVWGQQARETIGRAYSLEAMLTRLQTMYEELAA